MFRHVRLLGHCLSSSAIHWAFAANIRGQ